MAERICIFDWLSEIIHELIAARFYGKVTLCFEAGKLVHVRKEETLQPPQDTMKTMPTGHR